MVKKILFNLLPKHIVIDYLKLQSVTSNLQRKVSSIAFIKMSLNLNLLPTFSKLQGQFVHNKDKTRTKESISKTNIVEHRKNIQILVIKT